LIVDASALHAIVLGEPDAESYARAIAADPRPRMEWAGDATAVSRFGDVPRTFGIDIIPFAVRHAEVARAGRRLCGRPVHPAGLNFGDCLVYGVAKSESEPLLFKGNDFAQTDIEPALKD
jgi:ribonuclease VapC